MENLWLLAGLKEATSWAVHATELDTEAALTHDRYTAASTFIYGLLCQICSGKALTIVRLCAAGNGLQAWRHLCKEYEPKRALRWATMLSSILAPKWSECDFCAQWLEWERKIEVYQNQSRGSIPPDFRAAIVLNVAPKSVKDYFNLTPEDVAEDYEKLKHHLKMYFMRSRRFNDEGALAEGAGGTCLDQGQRQGQR
jgi:hypothetical protein